MKIQPEDITALILAGGRGSRMGGVDKGLQPFNGLPLALHTLTRLQMGGHAGPIIVNANRNLAAYESLGTTVWPDSVPDYAGPLAGFLTGLERCETPYLVTAPCYTPLLPLDLVPRLAEALQREDAQIAMAAWPEPGRDGVAATRTQPVFCLLRADLLESLNDFIQQGGRKIEAWTAQHKTVLVRFDQPGDDPHAFFNANTLVELQHLASLAP